MKTLAQIAADIAEDVGRKDDPETIAKAKNYLADRLRHMWDLAPWKDSLCITSIEKNPAGTTEPAHILYMPRTCDVVLGVRTSTSALSPFALERMLIGVPEKFTQTGTPYEFAQISPAYWTAPTSAGVDLQIRRRETDPETQITITYTDTAGEQYTRTITPATTMTAVSQTAFVASVDSLWQNGTTSLILSDDVPVDIVEATDFTPKVRLALGSIPPETTTFSVLFKRKCPTWTQDYQEPPLRGSDRLLQTFAHADILEWLRKPGKAQAKAQEAAAMFGELRDKETWQEATIRQIIPDCGPDVRMLVSGAGIATSKASFF